MKYIIEIDMDKLQVGARKADEIAFVLQGVVDVLDLKHYLGPYDLYDEVGSKVGLIKFEPTGAQ